MFVGDGEDDTLVRILKNIGVSTLVKSAHDNMRALYKANMLSGMEMKRVVHNARNPRAGGVHENSRLHGFVAAAIVLHSSGPGAVIASSAHES